MMQEDEGVSHRVTTCDSGCTLPTILSESQITCRRSLGNTPSPATRQVVPKGSGSSSRLLTAASRHAHLLLKGPSRSCRSGYLPLIHRAKVGYLTSDPGNPVVVGGITESKSTAKIKHRGPGPRCCVPGHQPRCASTIRLSPPFILALNARGEPRVRIRGSNSS